MGKYQIVEFVYSDGSVMQVDGADGDVSEAAGKALVGQPPDTWFDPNALIEREQVGTQKVVQQQWRKHWLTRRLRQVPVEVEVPVFNDTRGPRGVRRLPTGELVPYDGLVLVEVRGKGSHQTGEAS